MHSLQLKDLHPGLEYVDVSQLWQSTSLAQTGCVSIPLTPTHPNLTQTWGGGRKQVSGLPDLSNIVSWRTWARQAIFFETQW